MCLDDSVLCEFVFMLMMSNDNQVGVGSTGVHTQESSASINSNVRGKSDPAWAHVCENIDPKTGKKCLECIYCKRVFLGAGINRLKLHLAQVRGEIGPCLKVPVDVKWRMLKSVESIKEKKQQSDAAYESDIDWAHLGDRDGDSNEVEVQEVNASRFRKKSKTVVGNGKRPIDGYFAPKSTPGGQPSIKSALASKEMIYEANCAFARWMYDTCIPFNVVNSPYFRPFLDAASAVGPGFSGPSYHECRTHFIKDMKKELEIFIDSFRNNWKYSGCSIMSDGWQDTRGWTLINFLVYCPLGMVFIKSVDASDIIKTAENLFGIFKVVEWVGKEHVVQVITDNAANYAVAGRLLEGEFPSVYWSPCAAHCINLMLQEIGTRVEVKDIVERVAKVTKFIYNHIFVLSLLRKRPGWTEIIRPTPTRFATNFLALQSIFMHKHDLQYVVTCQTFIQSRYGKDVKGKEVNEIVMDSLFWKSCRIIVKVTEPLVRVLRIVDSDERPTMGYIYEAMERANEGIKKAFSNRKTAYDPYLEIVGRLWDKQLHRSLHAAGYYLNPLFQYTKLQEDPRLRSRFMDGLMDVVDKMLMGGNSENLNFRLFSQELTIFETADGSFGRKAASTSYQELQPTEWWRMFGGSAPNLQRVATRVLSQTCSSSGCERNWSVFERVHTKKRNRLEFQRLNDLVYIHYNLRLKKRNQMNRNYDPIDLDEIDTNVEWVVDDEEEPPLLDIQEVEGMHQVDVAVPIYKRKGKRIGTDGDVEDEIVELGGYAEDDEDEFDPLTGFNGMA